MSATFLNKVMDWDWHPQLLGLLIFIGLLCLMLPDSPWWAAIIAASIVAMPLMLILLIPYMVIITALALSLSLLQAIASSLRRSAPTTHSSPIR